MSRCGFIVYVLYSMAPEESRSYSFLEARKEELLFPFSVSEEMMKLERSGAFSRLKISLTSISVGGSLPGLLKFTNENFIKKIACNPSQEGSHQLFTSK